MANSNININKDGSVTISYGGNSATISVGSGGVNISTSGSCNVTASGQIALKAPSVTKNGKEIATY